MGHWGSLMALRALEDKIESALQCDDLRRALLDDLAESRAFRYPDMEDFEIKEPSAN